MEKLNGTPPLLFSSGLKPDAAVHDDTNGFARN
jgi:hypothetical protein